MQIVSKFLASATINGKVVSFFSPPHDEPDFVWVDVEELAAAFLPTEKAKQMVAFAQQFDATGGRAVATARNGDRIATIMCHSMAQGFCGFIDTLNGHGQDMQGPAHTEYCFASADVENDHGSLNGIEDITRAFHNNGGPFMRSMRDDPDEPDSPTAA